MLKLANQVKYVVILNLYGLNINSFKSHTINQTLFQYSHLISPDLFQK
jgi:hypothetical protein